MTATMTTAMIASSIAHPYAYATNRQPLTEYCKCCSWLGALLPVPSPAVITPPAMVNLAVPAPTHVELVRDRQSGLASGARSSGLAGWWGSYFELWMRVNRAQTGRRRAKRPSSESPVPPNAYIRRLALVGWRAVAVTAAGRATNPATAASEFGLASIYCANLARNQKQSVSNSVWVAKQKMSRFMRPARSTGCEPS
jgi:hypothetical protein